MSRMRKESLVRKLMIPILLIALGGYTLVAVSALALRQLGWEVFGYGGTEAASRAVELGMCKGSPSPRPGSIRGHQEFRQAGCFAHR